MKRSSWYMLIKQANSLFYSLVDEPVAYDLLADVSYFIVIFRSNSSA